MSDKQPTHTAPLAPEKRLVSLDVLRGFALLGILIMNIQSFAMPAAAYFIPTAYGDLEGANRWVWILSHLFTDQKFMTIFSILFGAGIVLFTEKLEAKGIRSIGVHYRRTFWLLVIGLSHAYLLWSGDILVAYALCALIIYWFRKWSPRWLLVTGVLVFAIGPSLIFLGGLALENAPPEVYAEATSYWEPTQEEIAAEIEAYQGGWLDQMTARVPASFEMQTASFFFWSLWRAGGLMLVGMALYKWGVLSASRSPQFYTWLMIAGFGIGYPVVAYGIYQNFAHGWDATYARFDMGYQGVVHFSWIDRFTLLETERTFIFSDFAGSQRENGLI
ncbi:DUF418 domain-containing protein [Chloroflexi bacterium TSY]|nr:DUF418 domain-containing protein [Chloroflexi bacterium TSY]